MKKMLFSVTQTAPWSTCSTGGEHVSHTQCLLSSTRPSPYSAPFGSLIMCTFLRVLLTCRDLLCPGTPPSPSHHASLLCLWAPSPWSFLPASPTHPQLYLLSLGHPDKATWLQYPWTLSHRSHLPLPPGLDLAAMHSACHHSPEPLCLLYFSIVSALGLQKGLHNLRDLDS